MSRHSPTTSRQSSRSVDTDKAGRSSSPRPCGISSSRHVEPQRQGISSDQNQAVRVAKSRLKGQDPMASIDRNSRNVVLSATLLNVGLLHLCHEDDTLRSAAHDLLCSLTKYLDYDGPPFLQAKGLRPQRSRYNLLTYRSGSFVPANTSASALPFCDALSKSSTHLTLDYIFEFCVAFDKLGVGQKTLAMQFVVPWLRNMNAFVNPLSPLFDASKVKLRECLRFLIDITVKDVEVSGYSWECPGPLTSSTRRILLRNAIYGQKSASSKVK
jgi:hypothetical protein